MNSGAFGIPRKRYQPDRDEGRRSHRFDLARRRILRATRALVLDSSIPRRCRFARELNGQAGDLRSGRQAPSAEWNSLVGILPADALSSASCRRHSWSTGLRSIPECVSVLKDWSPQLDSCRASGVRRATSLKLNRLCQRPRSNTERERRSKPGQATSARGK